jgi:hypothetical protein
LAAGLGAIGAGVALGAPSPGFGPVPNIFRMSLKRPMLTSLPSSLRHLDEPGVHKEDESVRRGEFPVFTARPDPAYEMARQQSRRA